MFAKEAKRIANEAREKNKKIRQEALNAYAATIFKIIRREAEGGYYSADVPMNGQFTKDEVIELFEPYGYTIIPCEDKYIFRWF